MPAKAILSLLLATLVACTTPPRSPQQEEVMWELKGFPGDLTREQAESVLQEWLEATADQLGTDTPVRVLSLGLPRIYCRDIAGEYAIASLEYRTDDRGNAGEVKVKESTHPLVTAAAVAAMSKWQLSPMSIDGETRQMNVSLVLRLTCNRDG